MGRPILILRATAQQDDSALAQAAAALSSGQSASFTTQSSFGEPPLEWQTAFYHDATNGLIHLMSKPANDDEAWGHEIYTVATDTWGSAEALDWSHLGHIYGNFTMDFASGDVYQVPGGFNGSRWAHRWAEATQTWTVAPASGDIFAGALADIPNGAAYHPNLYGSGDGGLVIDTQFRTLFWRRSTDASEDIAHDEDEYGNKEGVGVYWPSQDVVLIGGADASTPLLKVTPNDDATPSVTSTSVPPIAVAGHSHEQAGEFGSLHVHPGDPSKLIIVGTNSTNVWTSTDGSNWTQVADHPVTRMPRVVCSLRGSIGALWFIGCDETGQFSTLWKPE